MESIWCRRKFFRCFFVPLFGCIVDPSPSIDTGIFWDAEQCRYCYEEQFAVMCTVQCSLFCNICKSYLVRWKKCSKINIDNTLFSGAYYGLKYKTKTKWKPLNLSKCADNSPNATGQIIGSCLNLMYPYAWGFVMDQYNTSDEVIGLQHEKKTWLRSSYI